LPAFISVTLGYHSDHRTVIPGSRRTKATVTTANLSGDDAGAVSGAVCAQRVAMDLSAPALPVLHEMPRSQLLFSGLSIGAALVMLVVCGFRITMQFDVWQWWVPLALLSGMAAADFGSGLVHWGADTWGRDDLPVIGRRLLVPFRVHHVNPDDFLRRKFIDTNGDVAFLALPMLAGLLAVPLDAAWGGPVAVWAFAFCGIGTMTNQIHQWAHMPSPPRLVRLLQDCRLILGRAAHATHHARPYDAHYCITTGWCNRTIEASGLFRRLEAWITRLTGIRPRQDDQRYDTEYGTPPVARHG